MTAKKTKTSNYDEIDNENDELAYDDLLQKQSKKKSQETIYEKSIAEPSHENKIRDTIQKYRYNRNVRTVVLVVLLLILLAMLLFRGKMKWLILALIVLVGIALGLHIADYDLDIGTLIKTASFEQSRVETKKWVKIVWSDCITNNLNCANFATQPQAQAKYEYCANKIATNNNHVSKDEIKNLDVYGLDGDNDGIVCEALPVQ